MSKIPDILKLANQFAKNMNDEDVLLKCIYWDLVLQVYQELNIFISENKAEIFLDRIYDMAKIMKSRCDFILTQIKR
jgi:hypothetical protein